MGVGIEFPKSNPKIATRLISNFVVQFKVRPMLRSELLHQLKAKHGDYPELQFKMNERTLHIETPNEGGFPIGVHLDESEFTVTFADWHGHFDSADEVLNFVGFGLSDECRLRVVSRGGSPYKWAVESRQENGWHSEFITGTFIFKFWASKSEAVFQNRVLQRPNQSPNRTPPQAAGSGYLQR